MKKFYLAAVACLIGLLLCTGCNITSPQDNPSDTESEVSAMPTVDDPVPALLWEGTVYHAWYVNFAELPADFSIIGSVGKIAENPELKENGEAFLLPIGTTIWATEKDHWRILTQTPEGVIRALYRSHPCDAVFLFGGAQYISVEQDYQVPYPFEKAGEITAVVPAGEEITEDGNGKNLILGSEIYLAKNAPETAYLRFPSGFVLKFAKTGTVSP